MVRSSQSDWKLIIFLLSSVETKVLSLDPATSVIITNFSKRKDSLTGKEEVFRS